MYPCPRIAQSLQALAREPSLLQARARDVLMRLQADNLDAAQINELLLQAERLAKIEAAGKQHDQALISLLDAVHPQSWEAMEKLPCDIGKQKTLAVQMAKTFKLEQREAPRLRIHTALVARYPSEGAIEYCLQRGIPFDLDVEDVAFDTVLVNALDEASLGSLIAFRAERFADASDTMKFGTETPAEITAGRDETKFRRYEVESYKAFRERQKADTLGWNLTYIPLEAEAAMDGMDYAAYLDFFFEACDQPWEEIKQAQKKLIGRFNQAKELHITNDDGTDIRMSLRGHTFANSVVAHNTPGSEIFSGPVKESVEGVIVAKGNFAIKAGGKTCRMRDLTLRFEHGRIVEGHAQEGNDDLQYILRYDDARDPSDPKFEGSRHLGEIGIGTNPFIRHHTVNGLLVEKVGGSFHVALGDCYGNRYLGKPVYMENGNKSDIHWDMTTMLRGHGGRMYLDGHLIQKDGDWQAVGKLGIKEKDVAVLNKGWAALPAWKNPRNFAQRPIDPIPLPGSPRPGNARPDPALVGAVDVSSSLVLALAIARMKRRGEPGVIVTAPGRSEKAVKTAPLLSDTALSSPTRER